MRIIIAGPPKTGNIWIKCLLAEIYNLEVILPKNTPRSEREFADALEEGWFRDNTIFHQHFAPTDIFLEAAASVDSRLVTMIRNPYDIFVSLYFFVQNFPKRYSQPENVLSEIYGKPIDHPEVIAFLGNTNGGFGTHIHAAKKWVDGGKSILVRYEELTGDTFSALQRVTRLILPVSNSVIRQAIDSCTAQKMRKSPRNYRRHIRSAAVGDWKNHLNKAHLEAMLKHADIITSLGYEINT